MALIHDNLYISDNRDYIPLAKYLHSLSSVIVGTLGETNIHLTTDLETLEVPIKKALPLGLITNELLTNSIKYAFPGHQPGELTIRFNRVSGTEGTYKLSIKDNGIGLPESFSIDNPSSSGMLIVKMLIEQLNARLEIDRKDTGTEFHIYLKDLKH
jgi:two-component sensor histidine kinase